MPVIPGGSLVFRQLAGRSAADPLAAHAPGGLPAVPAGHTPGVGPAVPAGHTPGAWPAVPAGDLPGGLPAALAGDLGAACSVRVVRIPPGARTPHRHPDSPEVVYVAEGRGSAWEDGATTPVTAGDLIAIPTGVPHATAATTELVLICFFPTPNVVTEELDGPRIDA